MANPAQWTSAVAAVSGVVWAITNFSIAGFRDRRLIPNSVVFTCDEEGVCVLNASELAILRVTVEVAGESGSHQTRLLPLLKAGEDHVFRASDFNPPMHFVAATVRLTFDDPRGYAWQRTADGVSKRSQD